MKYSVTLYSEDGEYFAECGEMGLTGRGLSATNALDQLRSAIRFNVELCPCSTTSEEEIELDVQG